jgi:hypothetical protein
MAAVMSEVILVDQQSLFYTSNSLLEAPVHHHLTLAYLRGVLPVPDVVLML